MRSAPPEAGPRRAPLWVSPAALRLTLGYAALFAASAVALFAITYLLVMGVLQAQSDRYARTQLRAFAEAYARGGVDAVVAAVDLVHRDDLGEEMLVRVADRRNRPLLVVLPEDWTMAEVAPLNRVRPDPERRPTLTNLANGQTLRVLAYHFADGAALQVGISSDESDDVEESFPSVFVGLALPLLALSIFGGAVMAGRALRPVRHLLATLHGIVETGDVGARASAPHLRGELAELFTVFNQMLDRIEGLMGRLRGTLDDVAHDLRTPLTRLRGAAELALRQDDPAALRDALADAVEATEAAAALLDAIMDVAEAEAGAVRLSPAPTPLAGLVADVADLYDLVAADKDVTLTTAADPAAVALVDTARMRRVLANLVDNAVKYTPAGGHVTVRALQRPEGAVLQVEDTGPGIAPGELPHIWDRLYRGDRSRAERGLGLGLSLVRALVEAHGGRVEVESRLGEGTVFSVHLPPVEG